MLSYVTVRGMELCFLTEENDGASKRYNRVGTLHSA